MATSSVNFVNALGAGSGIDTKALAQSMVDAERAPRKDLIDAKIKTEKAHITGLGAIKSLLTTLQTALTKVNDASDFASITTNNSQPGSFKATASTRASAGTYDVSVTQIAKATRLASNTFSAGTTGTTNLNGGQPFSINLSFPSDATNARNATINIDSDTPAGIMDAVNAQTKSTGISAQLVNTGTGLALIFTGQTGSQNDFRISGLPTTVNMRATPLQTAQDASLNINGLDISSSSNQVKDAIPGVTLDLFAPTANSSNAASSSQSSIPARLDLNRDTNNIKDGLNALVTAYNDFDDGLKVLGDKKSTVADYGGTMANDSFLQTVRNQVRSMFTKSGQVYQDGDSTKAVLNPNVNAAWQVGLAFDRNGKMTLDTSKLDTALSQHFDQVVTLFTANQDGQSVYSVSPGGLAGDAVKSIDKMVRSTGAIAQQTDSANAKITDYNKQLTQLEDRMTALLDQYTKQFAAMDSLVGNSKNTQANLKNSFAGLMAMYTKN